MKKKITFEEAMNGLEEIARILESGDISLDDSIKKYEEGIELIKFCESKLNEAQKKVQKLTRTTDGDFELTDMDEPEQSE